MAPEGAIPQYGGGGGGTARCVWTASPVTALPNHEMSWPAPATVSHAESSEPAPISIKTARNKPVAPKCLPLLMTTSRKPMVESNQENDRVLTQTDNHGSSSAPSARYLSASRHERSEIR